MLSEIITYLDSKLTLIGYMPDSKGLVEKVVINEKSVPASFCLGEWQAVNIEESFVYHRQNGSTEIEELDEEQSVSCTPWEQLTIPMRAVFCKLKSELNNNAFDAQIIGQDIAKAIHTLNNKSLCVEIGADTVQIKPTSIENDIYSVWEEEFKLENVPLDYVMVYVDYDIIVTGPVTCFEDLCQRNQ